MAEHVQPRYSWNASVRTPADRDAFIAAWSSKPLRHRSRRATRSDTTPPNLAMSNTIVDRLTIPSDTAGAFGVVEPRCPFPPG